MLAVARRSPRWAPLSAHHAAWRTSATTAPLQPARGFASSKKKKQRQPRRRRGQAARRQPDSAVAGAGAEAEAAGDSQADGDAAAAAKLPPPVLLFTSERANFIRGLGGFASTQMVGWFWFGSGYVTGDATVAIVSPWVTLATTSCAMLFAGGTHQYATHYVTSLALQKPAPTSGGSAVAILSTHTFWGGHLEVQLPVSALSVPEAIHLQGEKMGYNRFRAKDGRFFYLLDIERGTVHEESKYAGLFSDITTHKGE